MSREENRNIGSDLCKLGTLLIKYGLCSDTSPLQTAGQACISNATDSKWAYRLDKIVFNADEVGGRLAADTTDIVVSLTVEIEGCVINSANIYNPLTKLLFDIEIDGYKPNAQQTDYEFVYAAWHLDRHIFKSIEEYPKYSHPLYHFAFGGAKMEAKGHSIYGNSIILPSPRFIYPPMDAVLGIDFILQNYIHKNQLKGILADPEYLQIRKDSQYRIWRPFFCSMYTHWQQSTHTIDPDFLPKILFPLYC